MTELAQQISADSGLVASLLFSALSVESIVIAILWKWGNNHALRREEYLDKFVLVTEQSNNALNGVKKELGMQKLNADTLTKETRRLAEEVRDARVFGAAHGGTSQS